MVAIHPEVATADAPDGRASRRRGEELLEITPPGAGHRVAAVEHHLDRHARHLFALGEVEQRNQVRVDRVHAARADQPHEMERAAGARHLPALLHEHRINEESAVGDRLRDSHQILLHHSAGAEVEVPHLAVADLAARQADGFAGGLEEGARRVRPESVPGRHRRHRDRVPLALGAISPSVEDEEDDRRGTGRRCH